jgi:hypothetical protein
MNRPDLQYTLNGVRIYEEFDLTSSLRGLPHGARLMSNDPLGIVFLFVVN